MSDGVHLLIPFASSRAESAINAFKALDLFHLERLLARLAPSDSDSDSKTGDERTLSMPHERVLARECGLSGPDGLLPWAAWQVDQAGGDARKAGWAWITPCHWQVGADHVRMHPPQQLQLEAGPSRSLLAAMQPYLEQDGIRIEFDTPGRWLASGDLFASLPTASLDRVAGRIIDPWIPRSADARPLRRLQQEMQMLLYTHPVNEERIGAGLLPVNSFWVSGSGTLPGSRRLAPPAGLKLTHTLREAALLGDWSAWSAAWLQLDAGECAMLCRALEGGREVALTLCGERRARTWRSAGRGWRRRVAGAFSRKRAADWLGEL